MEKHTSSNGFTRIRDVPPHGMLFSAGDMGTEGYIVIEGCVDVFHGTSSEPKLLATLGKGELFGEMALIDASPRAAHVRAGPQGARIAAINAAQLVFLITNQPAFALAIVETLTRRLRATLPPVASSAPEKPGRPDRSTEPWNAASSVQDLGDGILQFQGFGHSANAYVLRGSKRTVLIDSCLPENREQFQQQMAHAGLAASDVHAVLLTHEHADHVGGTSLFSGTPVYAHRLAANKLHLRDDLSMMSRSFGASIDQLHVDVWLSETSVVDTGSHRLEVRYTPGHTSGHICFYEPRLGLLFSGDCVMAGGHIGGIFGSGNIADYMQTLDLLAGLDARYILPGHGIVSANPKEDIALAASRCEKLFADVNEITAAPGANHVYERLVRNARELNRYYRQT